MRGVSKENAKLMSSSIYSNFVAYGHTNEEDSSPHCQVHRNQLDTSQQCDSRKLFVHIEQQHELPALNMKVYK
jgi:hypothetical protein